VLNWLETPKSRLPVKLLSRPIDDGLMARDDSLLTPNDDADQDGMWNRSFAKSQSLKTLRRFEKKVAKSLKQDGVD
jgi:hypothetical protein